MKEVNRMHLNLVSSEHSKKVALSCVLKKEITNKQVTVGELKLEKPYRSII